jgi:hypothetical protein
MKYKSPIVGANHRQGQISTRSESDMPTTNAFSASLAHEGERRYSPAEMVSTEVVPVIGQPNPDKICTSHVERQNLSSRMGMRRMTRLTNAFSKKWENLKSAYAIQFAYYNFCRIHQPLRVTPAMEAGIVDHAWSLADLIRA